MNAFENFYTLSLLIFSISLITTAQSTTNSPNPCKFGGKCVLGNDGGCSCSCVIGFAGAYCEITLTKISGVAKYNVFPTNESITIETDNMEAAVRSSVNTSYTVSIERTTQNFSELSIPFFLYIERPSTWIDYKDANVLQQNLMSNLSLSAITNSIFGSSNGVSFLNVKINVDECVSNWTNCDSKAGCVDQDPGFLCVCDFGFEGNGEECSAILCKLSDAPSPPSLGNRIFSNVNGTIILDPAEVLPYPTSILYSCPRRYDMVNDAGQEIGVQTSTCQDRGWTPVQYARCSMNLEFRVALGISIVSSLIIVIVVAGFITHWCLQAEKRAKQRSEENRDRAELTLDEHDWRVA